MIGVSRFIRSAIKLTIIEVLLESNIIIIIINI